MPRRRRRRGGAGERGRARYTPTTTPSRRGVVDPPRTTTLRLRQPTVRTVLSSRIPRLPISFTPRFFVCPPSSLLPSLPLYLSLSFSQRASSSSATSSPFILLFRFLSWWWRCSRRATRKHVLFLFSSSSQDYQWATPRWLTPAGKTR